MGTKTANTKNNITTKIGIDTIDNTCQVNGLGKVENFNTTQYETTILNANAEVNSNITNETMSSTW